MAVVEAAVFPVEAGRDLVGQQAEVEDVGVLEDLGLLEGGELVLEDGESLGRLQRELDFFWTDVGGFWRH